MTLRQQSQVMKDDTPTPLFDPAAKVERQAGLVASKEQQHDEDGRRIYWALAYDATELDRHQTGMTADAFRGSAEQLEFPILTFHNRESYPVGKPVATEYSTDGLSVGFVFADTPDAKTAEQLVAGGFLRGVSVGFIPEDGYKRDEDDAIIFTRAELVELSLTPTPSSRKALVDLSRSLDNQDPEELIEQFGLQIEDEQGPIDKAVARAADFMQTALETAGEARSEERCAFCGDLEEECVCTSAENLRAASLTLPDFMKASLRRGLKLHEEGHSGDGLKPQTVADARKGAEGGEWSIDKHRRCAAWIARHLGDLDAYDGDKPTPGLVAMLLWGGGSTKQTAERAAAHCRAVIESHEKKSIEDAVQTLRDLGVSPEILRVIGTKADSEPSDENSDLRNNSQTDRENRHRRSSRSHRHNS